MIETIISTCNEATLHRIFEKSAQKYPDRPSLCIDGQDHSYKVLRDLQVKMLGMIRSLDLRGETIGLLGAKSISAYASLLAIMASGNAYLPLNMKFPLARIEKILLSANVATVIADASIASPLAEILVQHVEPISIILTGCEKVPDVLSDTGPHKIILFSDFLRSDLEIDVSHDSVSSAEMAYLLFTSGSTGEPKGVPVAHSNACATIRALDDVLGISKDDRVTQFSELTFDVSIGEMFFCWSAGACLVIPGPLDLLSPAAFIKRNAVTVWSSVPTLVSFVKQRQLLQEEMLPTLRLTLLCGEKLLTSLVDFWKTVAPNSIVMNLYGPSEVSIFSTVYICPQESGCDDVVPIGMPLSGLKIKIANQDERGGDNAKGELFLSGEQVVAGYWKNESATRRFFVADDKDNAIWYRTGDLVSFDETTGLTFHGRVDQQIKVRGHRVEIADIETNLRKAMRVDTVAVVPLKCEDGIILGLVAFSSPHTLDQDEIDRRLGDCLPPYMIPESIHMLDSFPLNDNGKIDYKFLTELAKKSVSEAS